MTGALSKLSRQSLEDFLFEEAALLDEWRLREWLTLFRPDATYLIPSLESPDLGPQDSLYFVQDDMKRLGSRVNQILGRSMWAENPVSRTRRLISNVRICEASETQVHVSANFAVYRMRHEAMDVYVGHYEHRLALTEEGLRFCERKAILDHESLRPHGKVSIIL